MTVEERFAAAWLAAWDKMEALHIPATRMRREAEKLGAITLARRVLGRRRYSDGFDQLAEKGRLDLTLEALVLKAAYGSLFTDEEANEALNRLMGAGYSFR